MDENRRIEHVFEKMIEILTAEELEKLSQTIFMKYSEIKSVWEGSNEASSLKE